jgi:multimeric flavodoxin WrbA
MKLVCLLGSPRRRGSTAAIAEDLCSRAEEHGAKVHKWALNDLDFRGCQGCMACKTRLDHCVLTDDLAPILGEIAGAQVLVLTSPVYFGDVTSQLKQFIDRTFSFLTPDFHTAANKSRLTPGKKLVFIQSQGNSDTGTFDDIYPKYEFFFRWYGFTESHLIRACGDLNANEALKRGVDAQVETVARSLFS